MVHFTQDPRYAELSTLLRQIDNPSLLNLCSELQKYQSFFEQYNVKLIFCADKQYCVARKNLHNEHSFSLFENENFVYINKDILNNPNKDICLLYAIFLDTNFTSNINKQDSKYQKIFSDIKANPNFKYVHSHYRIENVINNESAEEFLKHTKPTFDKWAFWMEVSHTISTDIYNDERKLYIHERDKIYLTLLKVILIERKNKQLTLKEKMDKLFDFINNEIYRLDYLTFVFAYLFFKKEKINFFDKLNQIDYGKLKQAIKNTSIDLMFINIKMRLYCKFVENYKKDSQNSFFMPFFATEDKGLKGFCRYVKWRGLLEIDGEFMPIYAKIDDCFEDLANKNCQKGYNKRFEKQCKADFNAIGKKLENELLEFLEK